jgi:hypothetical protein
MQKVKDVKTVEKTTLYELIRFNITNKGAFAATLLFLGEVLVTSLKRFILRVNSGERSVSRVN